MEVDGDTDLGEAGGGSTMEAIVKSSCTEQDTEVWAKAEDGQGQLQLQKKPLALQAVPQVPARKPRKSTRASTRMAAAGDHQEFQ